MRALARVRPTGAINQAFGETRVRIEGEFGDHVISADSPTAIKVVCAFCPVTAQSVPIDQSLGLLAAWKKFRSGSVMSWRPRRGLAPIHAALSVVVLIAIMSRGVGGASFRF